LEYQFIGLNDVGYNMISAFIHAGHVLAFAWAMRRAFPRRTVLIVIASLFVFHLPMVAQLLINSSFDAIHTAALIYWLCVVAFQHWGVKQKYHRLILPIALYTLSLLIYENAFLLLPVTGLMTAAVISQRDRRPWRLERILQITTVMVLSHLVGFLITVGVRIVWNIDYQANFAILPLNDILNYGTVLLQHLQIPFLPFAPDGVAIMGAVVTAFVGVFLLMHIPSEPRADVRPAINHEDRWLIWVAIALMIFGHLPYILAGYKTEYSFMGYSRQHVMGLIGIAILISMMLERLFRSHRMLVYGLAAVWLAGASGFLFTFRLQAAQWEAVRQSLYHDLLTNAPGLDGPAIVLIEDGQLITADAMPALVFGSSRGQEAFFRLFYNDEGMESGYTFPGVDSSEEKTGSLWVSQQGLYVPGFMEVGWDDKRDRVILLKREGDHFTLVDRYTASDHMMIVWEDGIDVLETNDALIHPEQLETQRQRLIDLGLLKD